VLVVAFAARAALTAAGGSSQPAHPNPVIDLWTRGTPAFGVFVPGRTHTVAAGEALAANPLYDFVFLNLEGDYRADAVKAIATGLRQVKSSPRKVLIVRIPSIATAGADATAARVKDAIALGADGVTIPHVRGAAEAKQAIGFFQGANVWSRTNRAGTTIAMLMIEDPAALEETAAIAALDGYSILACGIGSLRAALGGNRDAAEAGTQKVLAETKRAGLVNMLTASPQDVEPRVKEGFLALLAQGASADETIRAGRKAAGR
jgi:2-keto-3-deoxy-L-rhamnonate aldolase RhmA